MFMCVYIHMYMYIYIYTHSMHGRATRALWSWSVRKRTPYVQLSPFSKFTKFVSSLFFCISCFWWVVNNTPLMICFTQFISLSLTSVKIDRISSYWRSFCHPHVWSIVCFCLCLSSCLYLFLFFSCFGRSIFFTILLFSPSPHPHVWSIVCFF